MEATAVLISSVVLHKLVKFSCLLVSCIADVLTFSSVSGADDDEFAAYDFSEFTEEDFARIDADIAKKEHLAKVVIAYETVSSSYQPCSGEKSRIRPSPLEAFRRCSTLSVTDLASPCW